MSDFSLYFQLGLEHIADLLAYDHMLFIIALCILFQLKEWKKVLVLITAFTIGHSITLALAVLDIININSEIIEILIPITILITSIYNISQSKKTKDSSWIGFHYMVALFFGLIHGMGFANYLNALLGGVNEVTVPLLSFNLGIELGQIGILVCYFLTYYILKLLFNFEHRKWIIFVSLVIGAISCWLLFQVLGK